MSEQEYLEMIVAERIQMILADMEGGAVMDGEEEWEKTLDGLEEAQRKAIEGTWTRRYSGRRQPKSICTLQA